MSLPKSILCLSSLEVLNLSGCSKLSTSSGCKRLMLPFHFFDSRSHKDSIGLLLPSFPSFSCLRHLDLSFCKLLRIPDAIGLLHSLERLDLGGNNFVTLPCSIKELPRLISLNLQHCKQLASLSEFPLRTVFPVPRDGNWLRCGKYQAGLCIFDCPKLVEMESWSSVAVAWMIQVLQVHKESSPPITIVIPGTQIPSWFINQSVGHSIMIEPNSFVHDSDCIGVAFCAAFFVAHPNRTNYLSNPEEHFRLIVDFVLNERRHFHFLPVTIKKDLVTVEWDHLCLLYFTREDFINLIRLQTKDIHDIDVFRFEVCSLHYGQHDVFRLEVKNCGMRVVFKQDLEELNPTVTNNDLLICG